MAAKSSNTPRTEIEEIREEAGMPEHDRFDDGDYADDDTENSDGGASGEQGAGGDSGSDDANKKRRRRRRRRTKKPNGTAGEQQPPTTQRSAPPQRSTHHAPSQQRPRRGRDQHNGRDRNRDRNHDRSNDRNNDRVDANAPVIGTVEGILELHPKGYGFLRDPNSNYAALKTDAFVPSSLIDKNRLREGLMIRGEVTTGVKGQGPRLKNIENIDGRSVEDYMQVRPFDELTAVNPFEQIHLETGPAPVTMRVMDLLTPIGKGQRALIVAPPRTGKTMLLQEIANAVSINHPELHLMVLLIDERPEEVTEMRRRVQGEVIASSMDRDVESHVRISQLIIERGKRIAEAGGEVFILLDSITRTARAFNKWVGNTGRTMTGGLDVKALDIPKKMFGTARRFDEGGSLTVVATALIDTGSAMDQVIFQEFKGTGNMELVLNRQLADRRVWPAIDISLSGTRREEKILAPDVLEGVTLLRRSLVSLNPIEAMEQLIKTLQRFPSNKDFLTKIRSIL